MTPELQHAIKRYNQWFGSYKKSGDLVKIQVWLTINNGCIEFLSAENSYKVKRIRRNPKVQLAPCTIRGKVVGPTAEAIARILSADEEVLAKSALKRVVPSWRLFTFLQKLRGASGVYLEIVPVKK